MQKATKALSWLSVLALIGAALPWNALAQGSAISGGAHRAPTGLAGLPPAQQRQLATDIAALMARGASAEAIAKQISGQGIKGLQVVAGRMVLAAQANPELGAQLVTDLQGLGAEGVQAAAALSGKLGDGSDLAARGEAANALSALGLAVPASYSAFYDGLGAQAGPEVVVPEGAPVHSRELALTKAGSSADREILSLAERIARGITRNDELKLVPWQAQWEGDRPSWRLIKEGENLQVQYAPEDLRGADKDAVMARFMQEVLRAVYSRPDLIERDLQSNALFQTLYDTMETGRVVQKGLKERPGLAKNFSAFNQEQYRDPRSEAAAQSMKGLPGYLRFLEGALYESRQGQEDPRVRDPRVREVLKKTRPLREKIAAASPEEAYKLSKEIWPTLQTLYKESEDAAMSQKLFEKLGQEGKLGSDKGENAAAGKGQLKLDDLSQQRQEQLQKELEKMLSQMSPQEREELKKRVQQEMRQQEQAFRKTMGKSQSGSPKHQNTDAMTEQLEQAASRLAQAANSAKGQAQKMGVQAGQLQEQAARLDQAAQEFRRMAEQLKKGASSGAAEQAARQARQLEEMGKGLEGRSRQLQDQTQAAKDITQKAGQIQAEAQKAQALSEALRQQLGGKGSKGEEGNSSSASGEQAGQGDSLEQMLKAWAQQQSSGKPGQGQESGDSSGKEGESQSQADGGEIVPSGTQGTSDSIGTIEDKIEKIKAGGLDAEQRSWLEKYLEPVHGMVDTLAYKMRKHLKATVLGRDITGLFEGDVDEDALPYYKARIGIMKEELLPGRPSARITMLLDLSGSMGKISGGGSLDHATRGLLMALKAFRQAFKSERGVEVRIVAYNENPQLSILGDYMQVKDLSDAVLYRAVERIKEIQNTCHGDNCDVRMMDKAVSDIWEDVKRHPDATYALLHIGDGDPGADIASKIRAIYDDPANAKIRFANLAAGPQAKDMFDKYQPYSFWARALSELGTKWAEIVEATFKKSWRRPR